MKKPAEWALAGGGKLGVKKNGFQAKSLVNKLKLVSLKNK
jgi:hypothetical protein